MGLLEHGASGVLAGDFNGDGLTDLIGCLAPMPFAKLHTNAGQGRLVLAMADLTGIHFHPKQAVKGNFNVDGSLDIAFWSQDEGRIHVYTNSSGGSMSRMASIAIPNVSALASMAALCQEVGAQNFRITSFSIDGGSNVTGGGRFRVEGRVGHPTSGPSLIGLNYQVDGGWVEPEDNGVVEVPVLSIQWVDSKRVRILWGESRERGNWNTIECWVHRDGHRSLGKFRPRCCSSRASRRPCFGCG